MRIIFSLILSFLVSYSLLAQDPLRFEQEVKDLIKSDSSVNKKDLIVFAGSSSFRFWKDLSIDFPDYNVLNRGFGGSEMSDLLYYLEPLVLNYQPSKIFIYEGDNDTNTGKSAEEILKSADQVLAAIRSQFPTVPVIFVSPKPSIARWHLKTQYESFNSQLKAWTYTKKGVQFADVWTPMLDANGEIKKDIFIEDDLHMNRKGYDIWVEVIRPFLEK